MQTLWLSSQSEREEVHKSINYENRRRELFEKITEIRDACETENHLNKSTENNLGAISCDYALTWQKCIHRYRYIVIIVWVYIWL